MAMTREELEAALDSFGDARSAADESDGMGRKDDARAQNAKADALRAEIVAAFDALRAPDPAADAAVKLAAWVIRNRPRYVGDEGRWARALLERGLILGAFAAEPTDLGRQLIERAKELA